MHVFKQVSCVIFSSSNSNLLIEEKKKTFNSKKVKYFYDFVLFETNEKNCTANKSK